MQYRDYGRTGHRVSTLGMGCMRLPRNEDNTVDREKAYKLIRRAAEAGVNYFDTAYGYHSQTSEEILGEALSGGLREKVWIATKQPFGAMKTQADIRRNLENTLTKLRTDYIDVYLIHCIVQQTWGAIQERRIYEEYEKFREEGLIRHIGFSYHGGPEAFRDILASRPWDMCQIQQNLLDTDNEVTSEAIRWAGEKNVALVIMEPLRGGGLANAPAPVKKIYDAYPTKRSAADWAFRHLLDSPEVHCILSGMSSMEQLEENIQIFSADDSGPGCLSAADKSMLAQAKVAYESIVTIPCTGCEYCLPCPKQVAIPEVFGKYNDGHRFEYFDQSRRSYLFMTNRGADASKCVACGACTPKCPQGIDIPTQLQTAHEALCGWVE